MVDYIVNENGVERQATNVEKAEIDARNKAWTDDAPNRKLKQVKEIRLEKLIETDYLANSDVTMPNNVKTWRQTLRDLPANHVDEAAYDLLLVRDADGNLTHSIWSKP
tara:strand:+ start:94 stop:417 length:324 start_codon:yes stop_codon:yes gene_type:complete